MYKIGLGLQFALYYNKFYMQILGRAMHVKLVVATLWSPLLSSHPVLEKYCVEILHHTLILHHDKCVTVGVLPGGRGVGWKGVPAREI